DSMDIVTIKGYSNTVYSIEVVKSHGILKIINKESIRDGVIEIDTDVHKNLSDFTEMKIHEGKHKVVVKGSNCEPFSQEILINQDEDYQLDLSSIQIKTGVLIVTANVKDVTLTVNGKTEKMGEPLILDYGTYKVKVTKDEYHDYEEDVKVDKDEIKIKAELKKIVKKGKLTVSSTPNGADLYVDNSKVGITPVSVEVDRGTHTITVRKLGYKDFYLSSVDIGEKESVYNVELQSDVTTSSQSVNTSPDIQNNTQNDSQGTNQNNLQNNTQNSTQNNTQNNTPNNTVQDNEPSNANGANQPSDALSDNQPVISENEQQSGQ
ncbi:MAG: PEGA domain-containing protein, partial [Firmicutes bacterium]|nr:PEGA domain-containing protein [Bacillota bacterium]